MTTTAKEVFEQAKKEFVAAHKKAKAAGKTYFEEGSKELFEKYPEMTSFSWTQYTPYFNDGDTCYFSANTEDPQINGEDVSETKWNDKKRKSEPSSDPLLPAFKAVKTFLTQFSEDDYEDMFGDHVQVNVTAHGAEAEDYDHD